MKLLGNQEEKMRKIYIFRKPYIFVMVVLLLVTLLVGIEDNSSEAAPKVSISRKTTTLAVGSKQTISLKNNKRNVKWSSSNSKVCKIVSKSRTKVVIKGIKAGKAAITARISGKSFKCRVLVVKKSEFTGIHRGKATFYDLVSAGAANLDDFGDKYYTAALNTTDYMNNMAGAYLQLTDKDGDAIKVLVTDRLPEGTKGDIDLTRKAFKKIEPEVTGVMRVTWKVIPLPTTEPVSYLFKPSSSQYWAEVQVRNHRYPIASLEYYDKNQKKYVKLERQEYNYFTAPSGMGEGPFTFRVTDIYGHKIVDKNIKLETSGKAVKGKANFPY